MFQMVGNLGLQVRFFSVLIFRATENIYRDGPYGFLRQKDSACQIRPRHQVSDFFINQARDQTVV